MTTKRSVETLFFTASDSMTEKVNGHDELEFTVTGWPINTLMGIWTAWSTVRMDSMCQCVKTYQDCSPVTQSLMPTYHC